MILEAADPTIALGLEPAFLTAMREAPQSAALPLVTHSDAAADAPRDCAGRARPASSRDAVPDPAEERHVETFDPGSNPRAFRAALGAFATGVTVVTARGPDGAPVGITANSFASVSLDPPLVLWCPARASRRFAAFAAAERFAIHVLAQDQQAVCDAFVRPGEGFAAVAWIEGPGGTPLIEGCLARLTCDREAMVEAGDHAILIGRVTRAERREGAPLVFQAGRYGGFVPAGERHPAPDGGGVGRGSPRHRRRQSWRAEARPTGSGSPSSPVAPAAPTGASG